jgi:hypothetical protein
MAKKKTLDQKIDALTTIVEKGFAAAANDIDRLEGKIGKIENAMATKDDLKELEERLGKRIDGLNVKIEGVQKTVDQEAVSRSDLQLPRRVHDVEEKVFGHSKHPKHLPL